MTTGCTCTPLPVRSGFRGKLNHCTHSKERQSQQWRFRRWYTTRGGTDSVVISCPIEAVCPSLPTQRVDIQTHAHAHTCTHTHTCTHILTQHPHAHTRVHIHIIMHTHTHACTHTPPHTHTGDMCPAANYPSVCVTTVGTHVAYLPSVYTVA